MTLQKLSNSLLVGSLVLTGLISLPQASAQTASEVQLELNMEKQAQSENTARSWYSAGESWLSIGQASSVISSRQDWVKDRPNTANREVSVAIMKRAIACLIKSYELEGEHDTPQSRARSDALRCLQRAYGQLIYADPSNATWHYLLGEAKSSQGLYKQAQPDLNKAVQLGGTGGAKASALLAHTKPYLANQLANDHALWAHNDKVDKWRAAHPVTYSRPGVNMEQVWYKQKLYQNAHPGSSGSY